MRDRHDRPAPGAPVPRLLPAALLVAAAAAAPFLPTIGNGFTSWDDPVYVTANPHVRSGLGAESFAWAFTTGTAGNWHPLTWLSHQLDWTLFGDAPGAHHAVSLLLHALSAALLFAALARATGSRGKAAAAAILWAVHPLRVESVAWAAERKDVLSTLFWTLGMLLWVERCRRPSRGADAAVAAALALGLLAKPMLVTFPLAMLLLDAWPLARLRDSSPAALVLEKWPLFALAAASSMATLAAQRGAMTGLEMLPLPWRIENAALACAAYVGKTLWPSPLLPFYEHAGPHLPLAAAAAAALAIAGATVVAFRLRRRAPYLTFGWTWFLATLVPVIGIVQVGRQSMADRYTYVPAIGLAVAVAWGCAELLERMARPAAARRAGAGLAGAAALVLASATWIQTGYWKDTSTLFGRTLEVDPQNTLAHLALGHALEAAGRTGDAIEHYRAVLRRRDRDTDALRSLAGALVKTGGGDAEAEASLRALLREVPGDAEAHFVLSGLLDERGAADEALAEADRADALGLATPEFLAHAARLRARAGRLDDARRSLEALVALRPDSDSARANLAAVYERLGRSADAQRVRGGRP